MKVSLTIAYENTSPVNRAALQQKRSQIEAQLDNLHEGL